jgi:muconolactone delta-isomerase
MLLQLSHQRSFFIVNADSHEDLMQELTDCPIGPISEFDVHPICDFDKATDITVKKLKNLSLI